MEEMNAFTERRAHPRYGVNEGTYAAISPNSDKMGQIINISRGGLAFRYIVQNGQVQDPLETHVFVGDNGFYLEKMPYETVADYPVPIGSSLSSLRMRVRRIRFGPLSDHHTAQLDYFLSHRTTGCASS